MHLNWLILLLDPWPWPEGSYLWIMSVCHFVWKFYWLLSFFWNLAWTHLVLYMMEPHFLKIIFFPQKWGKWAKPRFPEWIGKFSYFFLHLVYNESLYWLLYALTNLIFGKILVPGIWTKMLLTNQIVGFLNQLYLYKKMTKKSDFLHNDTNSLKLWS